MEDTTEGKVSKNWTVDSNLCGKNSSVILNNGVQRKKNKGISPCYFKSFKCQGDTCLCGMNIKKKLESTLNAHKVLDINLSLQKNFHLQYLSSVTGRLDWLVHECDEFGKKNIPKWKQRWTFLFLFFNVKKDVTDTGRKWFIAADMWSC